MATVVVLGVGAPSALANCGVSITLTPPTQTHLVGETATVTAEVLAKCHLPEKRGQGNVPVKFTILTGPNAGTTFIGNTNSSGLVSFSYTSAATGTDTISAFTTLPTGESGTSNTVEVVWKAPLLYTGRAYDASAGLTTPVLNVTLPPVNDIGPVSTAAASSSTNTILALGGPLVTASVLKSTVTTGAGQSFAEAKVDSAGTLLPAPLPNVTTTEIRSTSTSTCAGSTGTTTITFLQIGGTVVVGPGGLITGAIPANTSFNLGLVTVKLNEQLPIPGGLAVNAIHITDNLPLVGLDVKIAHAESDIHNC